MKDLSKEILYVELPFDELQTLANHGDAEAQYNLGYCYECGLGVEIDYEKAVFWYKKAAELGNPIAQTNLGGCYEHGRGVPQDFEKAFASLGPNASRIRVK